MNSPDKSSAEFFDARYRAGGDPWNLAHDPYEQSRYDTILHALEGRRYGRAYEPGCAVGALTQRLATICDRVDASDFSETAVEMTRQRCAGLPNVFVRCAPLSHAIEFGSYDLIVLSEIGYYFSLGAWQSLIQHIVTQMQPAATLIASHWLGRSRDHTLTGDEVHACIQHPRLRHEHGERHADAEHSGFRLDRWRRLP